MVAYKLELPPHAEIHDVFHVTMLKKYEGPTPAQPVPLPDLLHGRVLPTLEKILHARLNRGVWELLVKWTGRSTTDTTWEQLEDFKTQFPRVELTDELFVSEGEMLWPLRQPQAVSLFVSVSWNKGKDRS
jgi:hypothetical protein